MSVLKKNPRQLDGVARLTKAVKATLASKGSNVASASQSQALFAGMESMSDGERLMAQNHITSTQDLIRDAAQETQTTDLLDAENNPGMEAAAVILAASGDLGKYASLALKSVASGNGDIHVAQISGNGMDYGAEVTAAMEAFDEAPLRDMLDYSVGFNLFAARQDAFGEAFFKTVVVTPELGGIDVSVSRATVFDRGEHDSSGKRMNFVRKNLADAYVDPTILQDGSTDLVPVRFTDNSNAAEFVPAAAVGARNVIVAGVTVPTAPLLMGRTIDLLGISNYEALIGMGQLDINDAIDKSVKLSSIYLQTAAGKSAVRMRTLNMPQAQFVKGPEGNYRDTILSLNNVLLRLDKNTKAVDGALPSELALLGTEQYTAIIEVKVSGVLNHEIGNIAVQAFPLVLRSLKDGDTVVDITAGDGLTIKNAIEASKIIGFDIEGKRTNSNRRTVSKRLNTTLETNRYPIPVGAPITVQTPHTSNTDAADLKVLIAAARIRNSNNAVTQLLNTIDFLEEHYRPNLTEDEIHATFPGMARYLLRPFFEQRKLDMEAAINSVKSHEKALDVSAVLVNALRDMVYRMFRASRYQAALDVLTGGTGTMPRLIVGTDQVIARHLIVPGDTRTFGTLFEKVTVVSTQDLRMFGKIVVTFVRDEQDGPDPLSFGTHAWIPELVSTVANVARSGQQIKETQVQPRTLHFVNMPVMGVINVQNLTRVLSEKISTPAFDTDITNPWLEGFEVPTP